MNPHALVQVAKMVGLAVNATYAPTGLPKTASTTASSMQVHANVSTVLSHGLDPCAKDALALSVVAKIAVSSTKKNANATLVVASHPPGVVISAKFVPSNVNMVASSHKKQASVNAYALTRHGAETTAVSVLETLKVTRRRSVALA